PGATPDSFVVRTYAGGTWSRPGVAARTATSLQATGVSSFGDFAAGEPIHVSVVATAGAHGVVNPAGTTSWTYGDAPLYTFTPDPGYHVADVALDGVSIGSPASYAFAPLTTGHSLAVAFAINTYTLTPSAGAHGVIAPGTPQVVDHGGESTFLVTP